MSKLFRLFIKTTCIISYIIQKRKIPKKVYITTMYGYIAIDGDFYLYDKNARIEDSEKVAILKYRLIV